MAKTKKSVLLAIDPTCEIPIGELSDDLNRICRHLRFQSRKDPMKLPGPVISCPITYQRISKMTSPLLKKHSSIMIGSELRYDNNFYFESSTLVTIFSFWGWEYLTNLPKVNGLAWFITTALAHELGGAVRHDDNTGCVFDFLRDKRGIDTQLRGGAMCMQCYNRVHRKVEEQPNKRLQHFDCNYEEGLEDFLILLEEISIASKREVNVLERWKTKAGIDEEFDVFLCHNSSDKKSVRVIYESLVEKGINPWLDEEHLRPGLPWQDQLEATIPRIKSAAVLVGANGQGPWQDIELRAFLSEFAKRACPVIPVILKEAKAVPELPMFLQNFQWVDFRKSRPDPWKQLLWGITGKRSA